MVQTLTTRQPHGAAVLSIGHPNHLAVAADFADASWNTLATHEVWTVTGLVRLRMWQEVTGDVDSLAHGAMLQFGHEDDTDAYILATNEEDLDAGDLWCDATPAPEDTFANAVLDRVVNGLDVGYEALGEALTQGCIVFHCVWEALNGAGNVAAGAGGPL